MCMHHVDGLVCGGGEVYFSRAKRMYLFEGKVK